MHGILRDSLAAPKSPHQRQEIDSPALNRVRLELPEAQPAGRILAFFDLEPFATIARRHTRSLQRKPNLLWPFLRHSPASITSQVGLYLHRYHYSLWMSLGRPSSQPDSTDPAARSAKTAVRTQNHLDPIRRIRYLPFMFCLRFNGPLSSNSTRRGSCGSIGESPHATRVT